MATPPRTTEQEDVFGVMQTLLLVVILVVGALLITLPLFAVKIGDKSLAVVISALLPMKDLPWLPALLWVVEAAVYALIGWSLTRQIPAAVGAIVLGFVTRIIVCVLIALLLTTQESSSLPTILGNMHGNYWPYRIFALIPAWLALQWPFLPLLASGFGMNTGATSSVTKAAVKAAPKGGASGFAFNTTKAPGARPTTTTAFPTRSASRDDARPVHTLTPPADFVMPKPMDSLYGAVELPVKVILESVPEAEPFLTADVPVRVRLAFIAPQLARGTVWVTWGQIFSDNAKGGTRPPDDEIVDRWIRIRPKYYVAQVPRDLFNVQRTPPPWMRLSEVSQENQFSLEV